MNGHITRFSDASTYDEICVNCGAHDEVPGDWGGLAFPCTSQGYPYETIDHYWEMKDTTEK